MSQLLPGCQGIVCCPVNPFQGSPPTGITPQLEGLLWTIPCTGIIPFSGGAACFSVDPPDSVGTLVGDPSQLYDVTLLIRAVLEYNKYTGGTVIAGTNGAAILGGTPIGDGHNEYSLVISNPAQTYHLNGWDGNPLVYGLCHAIRYTMVVTVNSGATVTLRANCGGNFGEVTNFTGIVLPLTPGDPAFNPTILPQPYQTPGANGLGQWCQADAILIA